MNRTMTMLCGAVAAALLVLTGCGSDSENSGDSPGSSTGTPAAGPHNEADVSFATDMTLHHSQAVEMADMALATATNAQVKALAAEIKAAQNPEIVQLAGWLTGWGEAIPDTSMGGMQGMDHGSGMMTDVEMNGLSKATGGAFDRMWVEMMIRHHVGAVAMSRTEVKMGESAEANALAQSIITSQTAQITELRAILSEL